MNVVAHGTGGLPDFGNPNQRCDNCWFWHRFLGMEPPEYEKPQTKGECTGYGNPPGVTRARDGMFCLRYKPKTSPPG